MENTFTHEREVNFGIRQWRQYQHIQVAFVPFTAADVRGNSQDQRPELAAAACAEI